MRLVHRCAGRWCTHGQVYLWVQVYQMVQCTDVQWGTPPWPEREQHLAARKNVFQNGITPFLVLCFPTEAFRMTTEPVESPTPEPISDEPDPQPPRSKNHPPSRELGIRGKTSESRWLRNAILSNAYSPRPLTLAELADKLQLPKNNVRVLAHRLRKKGLLGPAHLPPTQSVKPVTEVIITDTNAPPPEPTVETTEPMSEGEALKRLSWTARYGPPSLRQDAQKRIIDLARQSGESAGPREPLGDEGRAARLASIMVLVGPATVRRAIDIAFPPKGRPRKEPIALPEPPVPESEPADA